jgi:hypothetical protein
LGDADLDGKIDVNDATAIQRHLAEYAPFSEMQLAAADVDGDGKVTVQDVTVLQRWLAEFENRDYKLPAKPSRNQQWQRAIFDQRSSYFKEKLRRFYVMIKDIAYKRLFRYYHFFAPFKIFYASIISHKPQKINTYFIYFCDGRITANLSYAISVTSSFL